jgi:hypothetical protein
MSNSDLSNRRVRSLPKKMTLSAQPRFLTVQSSQERFKPLDICRVRREPQIGQLQR